MISYSLFDNTFLRFIFVGIFNTLVGMAIMVVLYNLVGFGYWLSSAINYILTSILSFFLNKYFTFGVKTWSFKMIVLFILTIMISYLVSYGIAKPLVHYLFVDYTSKFCDNVAMLAGMCLFTVLNYIGQRFTFNSTKYYK
ncbi:MAG: GtrA family protein [Endomicrobium sp.]|jgi:putative flippase GtrA|nr:GtrA family protein [Endomicrobium sp.]